MATIKRPKGRPPELTEDDIESIVAAVELGASLGSAVLNRGYSRNAWQHWIRTGELAETKLKADPKAKLDEIEKVFLDFTIRYRKARGAFLSKCEVRYAELCDNDAEAMQWLLERANPDDWGDPSSRKMDELMSTIKAAQAEAAQKNKGD